MAKALAKNRQLNYRLWMQAGGAFPENEIEYLNMGKGQARAGAFTPPAKGTNQVVRPSDDEFGEFDILGRTKTAPEQGTIAVRQDIHMSQITLLEELYEDDTPCAFHIFLGKAGKSASDPHGWESKIVIPNADLNGLPLSGDFQGNDSDDVLEWNSEWSLSQWSRAVRVRWQALNDTGIATNVVGVAFGKTRRHQYALVKGNETDASAKLFYTDDAWETSGVE
jgi:hypothetical protein